MVDFNEVVQGEFDDLPTFVEIDSEECPTVVDMKISAGEMIFQCEEPHVHPVEKIWQCVFITDMGEQITVVVPVASPLGVVLLNGGLTEVARQRLLDLDEENT